ncbi:MAG: helix-turn-helix transcriptional regulator [Clostridia bacterium]|nr:helix-turn-helix transcriptional regulator [Clostridia bacterium]
MILADKIIELRKKNGWSQEELAEKLDVSRQAVSKWESAQSVPDMNRILLLSQVFGVSTDYLLKEEMEEPRTPEQPLPEDAGKALRRVSLEEAQSFLAYRRQSAARISLGVGLCVLSPVALILLGVGQETGRWALSEEQAVGLGLLPLFLLIGTAVALFVLSGVSGKKYEYLNNECFETEYGVSGFVRERRERTQGAFAVQLTVGIVLCVLSAVPIFVAMCLPGGNEAPVTDFRYAVAVAATLCCIACGVWLIVRACVAHGAYAVLLEEGEYSREQKRDQHQNQTVSACYWGVVTAGYLAYSFITGRWDRSWIVWPVAGVLYGVIIAVVGAVRKKDV